MAISKSSVSASKPKKKRVPKPEKDVWQQLKSLAGTVNGPEDLAAEHDHYLYGVTKKSTL